ncbi:hypothetical protein M422DRAFT_240603 [Sphaerobolus stellatus SS14]|nr:hypothetical protein M422DRAFT_240603 [Sphaerobolus stellatus SS14]
MVSFSKLSHRTSLSAAVLLLCASSVTAIVSPGSIVSYRHETHRKREVAPGLELQTFHPEATYETFGEGIELPLTKRAVPGTTQEVATAFVKEKLGLSANDFSAPSSFDGAVAKHAYFNQKIKGIKVANAVANVAINRDNKVVTFGSNFVKSASVPPTTPTVSATTAIGIAEKTLAGTYNQFPISLKFFAKDNGKLALTPFVDAHTGEIVNIIDFVANASYKVIPFNQQSINDGGFQVVTDPANLTASPYGWHSDGTSSLNTTTTARNNAMAYKTSQSSVTSQSSSGLNFIYNFTSTSAPSATDNVNVARTNAFYIVNKIHDITYRYGFTEAAYNFQQNNLGKGGKASDRVLISVQDSSGTNNANFATPADGTSGTMRMYIWTATTPNRDGAIKNYIVAHEMTHGLTNRLTGGGTGRCLTTVVWVKDGRMHSPTGLSKKVRPLWTSLWARIRSHPYSTSKATNPYTYATTKTKSEVHDIGEVWANILHNVYAALVGASYVFSLPSLVYRYFTDPSSVTALMLPHQPTPPPLPEIPSSCISSSMFSLCSLATPLVRPLVLNLSAAADFFPVLTARDAIIQADVNRYSSANKCTLWKAFASRGLGVNAASKVDNSTVPSGC